MTRRQFLLGGTTLMAFLGSGGAVYWTGARTARPQRPSRGPSPGNPVLVVLQLSGGNDGLNTVIPYGEGAYYDARPTLAWREREVLPLNGGVGLHPGLRNLHSLYRQGRMAVVQGVGYPRPNRSHFRSMDIWLTAEPEKIADSGWLGRYAATSLDGIDDPLKAIQIGKERSKAFASDRVRVPVVRDLASYRLFDGKTAGPESRRLQRAFLELYGRTPQADEAAALSMVRHAGRESYDSVEAIRALAANVEAQSGEVAAGLRGDLALVGRLLAGGARTRVFYVESGGFDDHADEKIRHARALRDVDEAVGSFYRELEASGLADRVMILVFSEFGRRVKENGSGGTDHGAAAPVILIGGRVKGGLYGERPSLTRLNQGDLPYQVDFRSVYYTVVEKWLVGDGVGALGRAWEPIGFV